MARSLEIGSDSVVTVNGLRDVRTGEFINAATVTGALKDSSGEPIYGLFAFAYREDSDGIYDGVIPASVTSDLEECETYILEVSASADSTTRQWREQIRALHGGIV
jgi:hypothetical protein